MDNTGKGQWFVLHTLSGQENRVRENIESQIKLEDPSIPVYEVLIPTEKVVEVKNGVKKETKRKLFPGYVFCRMDLYKEDASEGDNKNEAVWTFINGVQGVISFSCGGNEPMPMSDEEIGIWINGPDQRDETVRPAVTYQIGDHVRITDGPLESSTGVVSAVDAEQGKLRLTVPIFGRANLIEVELWQVERDEE